MAEAHDLAMDEAKFKMFVNDDGAFLGSLLCNAEFHWDRTIPTACTTGLVYRFNPDWFMSLPVETHETILLHELWHTGFMHPARLDGRDPLRWNMACDYAINWMLHKQGKSFNGTQPLLNAMYSDMSADEIYDLLPPQPSCPSGSWGKGDMDIEEPDPDDDNPLTDPDAVVMAVHAAVMAQRRTGCGSTSIDEIEELIHKRNESKVDWKSELNNFAQDKSRAGLDYTRRNRRYRNVVLPARGKRGRLTHLAYMIDASGSTYGDISEQFVTEAIRIYEELQPEKMTIVQFDTRITKVEVWTQGKARTELSIVGRGGTSFAPVADWIENNRPTGTIILTDMDAAPMRKVEGASILWLCVNNYHHHTPVQGRVIDIEV